MRILYGVAGEGMGHATRSRVVVDDLIEEHDLRLVASSDAHTYLAGHFPAAHDVWDLSLYDDAHDWERAVSDLTATVSTWPSTVRDLYRLAEEFAPDVVVTDCESFVTLFALRHSLPLISIDHVHAIDRCRHDPGLLRGHEGELWQNRQIVGTKVPNATHYVISTFFYPLLLEPRTTLVPPILRPDVLAARPERGEHLLGYLPSEGDMQLIRLLAESGIPCRIYGHRPGIATDVVEEAIVYRPFSEAGFIEDLRTARGVIAGGNFTLLSEAVYLGKPTLACPSDGHFGHLLNALYLDRMGYGLYASEPTRAALDAFLAAEPAYRAELSTYAQDANLVSTSTIRRVVAEAAGARSVRPGRRVHKTRR